MDTSRALSLLETLDDEIDDLEEALLPLVKAPLSEIASKLPLLDKAKLYVLVTYSIESMLFSYLRLHGVKAREHPVFTELTRVKQYFQKLKVAQNPVNDGAGKRENLILDKGAAQRIIAKGLTGNDKWDLKRAEQIAKERARAHIKFTELSEKIKQDESSKKRKAEDEVDEGNQDMIDLDSETRLAKEATRQTHETTSNEKKEWKSGKIRYLDPSEPNSSVSSAAEDSKKKDKNATKKKRKKKNKPSNKVTGSGNPQNSHKRDAG